MKKCPFCAESIADDSASCPYCKSNLAAAAAPAVGGARVIPTANGAVVSLVMGILGGFFITAVLALIFGYKARDEIKRAKGPMAGGEFARAGILLGWVYVPIAVLGVLVIPFVLITSAIAIPNLLRARIAANEASAVGVLRTVVTANVTYYSMYPEKGFAATLADLGPDNANLIDATLVAGTKNGYIFEYEPVDSNGDGVYEGFTLRAAPLTPGRTGMKFFFADESGVVRVSTEGAASESSPPI